MTADEAAARAFAEQAHGNQRYGSHPYVYHLAAVRQVLRDFSVDGEVGVAAWLHDAIEDTDATHDYLRARFGEHVADLVYAVSGFGATREEQREDYYRKIVALGLQAAWLKLADRIANVEESSRTSRRLFTMYRAEQPGFEDMIARTQAAHGTSNLAAGMLTRLREAFAGEAGR